MRRLACALVLLAAASPYAVGADPAARRAYLAEETRLAQDPKQFYLVLDPHAQQISLRLGGVALRRFALRGVDIGRPRVEREAAAGWPSLSFALVSEVNEPDRPIATPQTKDPNAPTRDEKGKLIHPPTNPLAESLSEQRARIYANVPTVYRLHFEPDMDLVVRGEPLAQDWNSRMRRLRFQLEEGWEGWMRWLKNEPASTRVVLFMSPEDAQRLYTALTLSQKMPLLVAAPDAS